MSQRLNQQKIDDVFNRRKAKSSEPASEQAVPFDFRRSDRISKARVSVIQFLYEDFARNLSMSLGAYLRSFVTATVCSIEQLKYGAFLEGLPSPTCVVALSLLPYEGNALMEMNTSLIFPILDLILGGRGKGGESSTREITIIEKSLLDTVFRLILNDLKEAWKGVAAINFQIESIENDPHMLQIFSPNEAMVAVSIELHLGEHSGMLNFAIPAMNVKTIGQTFDQQWMSRKVQPTEAGQARMLELLRTVEFICDAQLLGPGLSVRDLLALEIGDCLQFDCSLNQKVDLLVNGTSKFRGKITSGRNHRVFAVSNGE